MDRDKIIDRLKDIKDSIDDRQYNIAKTRCNLLIGSLLSEVVCDDCGAERADLCIHERKE